MLRHASYLKERWNHFSFLSRPSTPTTRTLISLEIVTVTICCTEPRRMAPITGPSQCEVPPIIGMASADTEYVRLKLDGGSTKLMYIGIAAPAAPISAPETVHANSFSCSVGTPKHSAASSLSRIARRPRPIHDTSM